MDIQKDIDVLYKEIDALQEEIVEESCMSHDEDDRLELLIAKATKFGELCAQRDAKSQAVHEGFVLVPCELSADVARKYAEAMFNKVEHMARYQQRDLSQSEFESFKNLWIDVRALTIRSDWKAMIEAQEQSHD